MATRNFKREVELFASMAAASAWPKRCGWPSNGATVRIYDPEKTLVDCFRYRNQIGMEVVLEALRLWRERRRKKFDALLKYTRMRHVERAMRPYLEAMQ